MATKPSPGANNWPPGIFGLTWAPDDVHLAVQFQLTAAINSVLVFDAFTATTIRDGRTAPAPCPVTDYSACGEVDPAYLTSGALSYMIQQVSRSGFSASAILVVWQAGHRTTLLSLPGRGISDLRHDRSGPGDLGQRPGPAEGTMDDLALVRRRSSRDHRPPAAGCLTGLRGRGDRLVSAVVEPGPSTVTTPNRVNLRVPKPPASRQPTREYSAMFANGVLRATFTLVTRRDRSWDVWLRPGM
jgi:hypothetical protein